MSQTETVQFQVTPELRRKLESEKAAALNLSLSAYIFYLHERLNGDSDRIDRHVREVFGKHGELMRRLAR